MTKLARMSLICAATGLAFTGTAPAQFLHWTPAWGVRTRFADATAETLRVKMMPVADTCFWFTPSVGIDLFVREAETHQYKAGIIPGVGYGLRYGAKQNGRILLGLDLFVQGALSEEDGTHGGPDYFNIDALPVFTFYDWVSIGYGWRFKLGRPGVSDVTRHLFSFGVHKTI